DGGHVDEEGGVDGEVDGRAVQRVEERLETLGGDDVQAGAGLLRGGTLRRGGGSRGEDGERHRLDLDVRPPQEEAADGGEVGEDGGVGVVRGDLEAARPPAAVGRGKGHGVRGDGEGEVD